MKSTVQTLAPSKKELWLEIPAPEVQRRMETVINRLASRVKIAGFREGRVPREIVRQRFSQEIERTLIDELAPEALHSSFKEHHLDPVGIPILSNIDWTEGQPLRFKAVVEVWPEFELADYQKIKVTPKEVRIEEEEVDQYLEQLRHRSAEYVPVEGRGVVEGDYVAAEVQGTDRREKKKFPAEKIVVLAGPSAENPLAEKLVGLPLDGQGNFEIAYAADSADRRLAGKIVGYRVKVLAIKEKRVPDLSDDFAKSLGDYETLEDLRKRIREDLLTTKKKAARSETAQEILKKLSDQIPSDLPESAVEREVQDLLHKFLQSPVSQGLAAGRRESLQDIKERLREQAVQNLKNHLLLKKVAEQEALRVDESEVETELQALAQTSRVPLARLRSHLEEEGRLDGLKENLLVRKAVDFLINKAIMNS